MSIVDEALNEAALRPGPLCAIAKARTRLSAQASTGERGTLSLKGLDELLASDLEYATIARYVTARGTPLSEQSVSRHCGLRCKCP